MSEHAEHHEGGSESSQGSSSSGSKSRLSQLTNSMFFLFLKRLGIFVVSLLLVAQGADIVSDTYSNILTNVLKERPKYLPGDTVRIVHPITLQVQNLTIEEEIRFRHPTTGQEVVITPNKFPKKGWGFIWQFFVVDVFKGSGAEFYHSIVEQPHPLLKITLIVKGILLFALFVMLMFYYSKRSLIEYQWFLLLIPLKIIIVTQFLLYGAADILESFNPEKVLEFGGLFSFGSFRAEFLRNKLTVVLMALILVRDLFNVVKVRPQASSHGADAHH